MASKNQLRERIEDVNTKLLADVKKLEVLQVNENHDRKVQIDNLSIRVDEIQNNANENIRKLREKIDVQEKRADRQDLSIRNYQLELQNANHTIAFLNRKLLNLEQATHAGLQHGREWNIEIDGIPINVGDDPVQLQAATLKILHAINVKCNDIDIDKIHRLPSRNDDAKPTIVRFHSRKLVDLIHKNKSILKNLADLQIDIPGLNADSRIFLRASQCSYYKSLSYNCRQLKRAGLIEHTFVGKDGRVYIKTLEQEFVKISHESELMSKFPTFEFNFDSNE